MKRINLDELRAGMKLARTIHYHYGGVMLAAGTVIEAGQIPHLREFGIRSLYIYEHDTSDIVVYDYIDEQTRSKISQNVTRLFDNLREETKRTLDPRELYTSTAQEMRRKIENDRTKEILDRAKIKETFLEELDRVIEGILSDEELCLCVGTIKTNQSHVYDHSIETTVHSAIIAKKLAFARSEIRELLVGSLLHDIGYIFIPEDVIHKPRPTPRDQDIVKQHTIFGYYLLKEQREVSLLSAHVAYQHHERQDGGGFPRRLKGSNRILRPTESIADTAGMIHRYAEVVAVPNYYDNLVSHQPNRPAHTPDEAVRLLREAAGTMLNAEVVNVFLSYIPVFPVGTQVMVVKGEHAGCKGVVSRIYSGDLARPTVRLLENRERRLPKPIDIDLRERDGIVIRALWS